MTAPNPTPPTPTPPPATGDKDLQAEIDKWKAMARKHEQQAKDNHAALQKLQADGDAKKSDMDKIMAKLEAADKRAAEADRRAMLGEVVANTGLSMAKVSRLQGDTIEALLTDAEQVFDWKPQPEGQPAAGEQQQQNQQPSAPQQPQQSSGDGVVRRPQQNLTPHPGQVSPPADDIRKVADEILRGPYGI